MKKEKICRRSNMRVHPKLIILVVYETKEKNWRGFCYPYDVTCEAKGTMETMKRLEKLVKLYEEGLEKYGYPKHLSVRPLSDKDDRYTFKKVKEKIVLDIKKDFLKFQAKQQKEKFRIKSPVNLLGYYCPSPLVPA